MRPTMEFVARQAISHNGVRAYNPGDDVPASAVENLGLTVGVDVLPAHSGVIPRPAGDARRAEWEAYWLGQGVPQEDIDGMTLADLAAWRPAGPNQGEAAVAGLVAERPGPNARKAEWVEYAAHRGMPRETAEESTIAQLADTDYDNLFGPEGL